jgi:hypothetical protein
MRILVCGGRWYNNYPLVSEVLYDYIDIVSCIIHGGAKGADNLAGLWAKANDILVEEYKADWNRYGKRAGYLRNKQMIDIVIAFPGGKGTANMVKLSREARIQTLVI